jgi:hypothetical protein
MVVNTEDIAEFVVASAHRHTSVTLDSSAHDP